MKTVMFSVALLLAVLTTASADQPTAVGSASWYGEAHRGKLMANGKKFDPKPSILDPFPCHSHGMVGFVKELIDEQAAGSIMLGRKEEFRLSKFESLLVTQGVVFVRKVMPILTAWPNPVPAGKAPGKTTVTWNSVDGKIYVSVNGGEEMLFAGSPRGAQEANWIEAGSQYEFRLYNAAHNELLAKVIVTRASNNHD